MSKTKPTRTIRKRELFDMQEAIKRMNGLISSELGDYRAKLRRQVDTAIEDMQDFMNTSEWNRVSKLFRDIDEQFAERNENGSPKRDGDGTFIISVTNIPKREEMVEQLKKKEEEAIKHREEVWREYIDSLNTYISIDHFVSIPNSVFPKNTPTEVKDWLWPVIDEKK